MITLGTLLLFISAGLRAQGVATAGIRGTANADHGRVVDVRIRVTQEASGFAVDVRTSRGQFLADGLEPGGPYTITARSIGFVPQHREKVFLTLGQLSQIDFVLQPIAAPLDTVTVVGSRGAAIFAAHADGGTGTTISTALLEHLPTLNRDVYDFVRLVPQISTKIGLSSAGLSAGGVGFRFNSFLMNGVSERTLSGGVSDAFTGAKSIPLDAVREYQVLLTPYDVRYGDFAGALVNAVTKSGSNTFAGSVFAFGRNDQLARPDTSTTPYQRAQYGFSLGGPIVQNRLQFFVASELQHFTFPADGPYVGQPASAERAVPVSTADLDHFDAIMKSHGLVAGSSGAIENGNPLRNLFSRVDLALPEWNSRLLVWNNFTGSDDNSFSRASRDTFSLSSYRATRTTQAITSAVQLHTTLSRAGGGHNELLVSHRSESVGAVSDAQQPIVRVAVPTASGGSATLNSGTPETAQGGSFRSSTITINDNLTLPFGASHVVTLGGQAEHFGIRRGGAAETFGTWSFASLRDFELGVADSYQIRLDFGSASAPMDGTQYATYVGDRWQASERLSVTGGIRADMLAIDDHAPYNALVDSLFDRRTDEMPAKRVGLSPRLGFLWDTGRERLRGGIGVFTGRYPLGWAQTTLSSYGVGGLLRCTRLGPSGDPPPAFNPDYRAPPTACLRGSTISPARPGDVDLLDRNLKLMQVARGSLAYDRRLPWDLVSTNEALVTHAISDFVLVNLNLPDPVATDRRGRVMYGTLDPNGFATIRPRSPFSEVIDLRNTSRNYSYQLSTRLEKTATAGASGFVSYTYSRARDVQTLLRVNTRGTVAWATARATSGRHDDLTTGISTDDVPHRVIVAGTYVAPWRRARTELSFYYVGESGRPFTYIASGTLRRGDLNADGSNTNDPIYVPRNGLDTLEIQFSGVSDSVGADNSTAVRTTRERAQQNAFESFIKRTSCLESQRGLILERNSCREPWSNTTNASVRQSIPVGGRAVEMQLDVFNVLNLLNAGWGQQRRAAPAILEHVGQTADPVQASRPIFRFNTNNPDWTTSPAESAFQLQLALRYRF